MRALAARLKLPAALALAVGISAQAMAAQPEAQFNAKSTTVSGAPLVDPRATGPQLTSYSLTQSLRSSGLLKDSLTLNLGVTAAKNDYSATTLILDPNTSATTPLGYKGTDVSGDAGAELNVGTSTFSLGYGQTLSRGSPYAFRSVALGANRSFYSQTTTLGGNFYRTQQDQPFTYFNSKRFNENRPRSKIYTSERWEGWVEQAMSDRWKTQLKLLTGQRLEDRPRHYGAELRNTYALSDSLFSRLDIGTIRESKGRELIDDSGYYSQVWTEAQLTYEVVYDFLVTASFGTTLEKEEFKWKPGTNQVGLDSYGLKLEYKGKSWLAAFGGNLSYSNTSFQSKSFVGTFSWNI